MLNKENASGEKKSRNKNVALPKSRVALRATSLAAANALNGSFNQMCLQRNSAKPI